MRKELNDYESQIKSLTGLSIPRFAHIRNRVKCNDCKKWFKATKYLPKEMVEENKYENCFDETPQPIILCGKCGREYWTKADSDSNFFVKRFKRSKRRQKIVNYRMLKTYESESMEYDF
jgi:uncharacterized protein with PIN domain